MLAKIPVPGGQPGTGIFASAVTPSPHTRPLQRGCDQVIRPFFGEYYGNPLSGNPWRGKPQRGHGASSIQKPFLASTKVPGKQLWNQQISKRLRGSNNLLVHLDLVVESSDDVDDRMLDVEGR